MTEETIAPDATMTSPREEAIALNATMTPSQEEAIALNAIMKLQEQDDYEYDDEDEGGDDYADGEEEEVDDADVETENFVVLTMEELRKRQNDDVRYISSVLSVSREDAILVLLHFNWSASAAEEKWFSDDGVRIRESIGLLSDPPVVLNFNVEDDIVMCGICLKDSGVDHMTAASCGHVFCSACLSSYISVSISDGPDCLTLRCPDPSCSVSIGENIVMKLVSKDDANKYSRYLIRSYVDNSKKLKWCPSPNCDHVIEYEFGSGIFDVKCGCSYIFCWNCLEENHCPVDCVTVANWNHKNNSEWENINWILLLVNSKLCPKCKKPIEKHLGSMLMTCSPPCNHQFCWLCMGPWSGHEWGSYSCNKYKKEMQDEEEMIEIAAKSIDKYLHYYQRWATNEDSRKKSLMELEQLQSGKLQKISNVQQVSIIDVEYITEAWQQILECRRVLKWTYAYGYYIADEQKVKREYFEFMQGEAEGALEWLHQCAEKEVLQYADAKDPSPDFKNKKEKLCLLTGITRDYFEHLVKAIENGLADVTTKDADCSELLAYQYWSCSLCTLYNSVDNQECEACFNPRPDN